MIPLRKSRQVRAQKSRSVVKTLPSPTGGWNSRDAISDMPPTDAVEMINWFPATTSVLLRYGVELLCHLPAATTTHTGDALLIDGVSGYATTPDSAALSITGNIDLRALAALDNWSNANQQFFISKGTPFPTSATLSYQLSIVAGILKLSFGLGGVNVAFNASTSISPTNGSALWVRAALTLNTSCIFYTSTDGVVWTQIGAPQASAFASINDTAAALELGRGVALGGTTYYTLGKIYRAQIYSGVAGTLAGSFNGADANVGATTVTSSQTGEIYTLAGAASIIYSGTPNPTSVPSDNIETLMAYSGGALNYLFAINSGIIWNVTTKNSPTQITSLTLGSSRWGHVNIATPGGNFLFMVNQEGLDSPYHYNGTTWTQPVITGITTTNIVNVNLHKNRLWFIEFNTLKAWYLPTQSVAGAVNALDLSSFAVRGGYLMAMGTWTMDAGFGLDDMAVFLTSEGEVLVYRGTDPSAAATWALVGVFWIGSPIGRRCFVKYAGDLLVITEDGIVPLSQAVQSSRLNPRIAISDKIQYAMSQAITLHRANFGWQVIPFPGENMLFVNIPIYENNEQEQYVMNTITGSWCRFAGMNANCWELFNDSLYFGGNDKTVKKAWTGTSDNSDTIEGTCLQAFNYFGSQGQQKRWTMMRPIFLANGDVPISIRMNIDFDQNIVNDANSYTSAVVVGSLWDQAVWDADVWAGDFLPSRAWRGASGVGFCAAPELGVVTADRHVRWLSTDIVVEGGAIL